MRRASALVAGVLVAALLVIAVRALLQEGERYSGTNSVAANQPVILLGGGQRLCQAGEIVPEDTAGVELAEATGGRPGPPIEVRLRDGRGRVLAEGRNDGGYADGVVAVAIPLQEEARSGVELCVRIPRGTSLTLYGNINAEGRLELAGKGRPGALRVGYKRPGSETWLALLPTIAERFAIAKTRLAGPWTFWFAWALLLLAAGIGLRTVLRSTGEGA